jgi:hypothetical protein
VKSTDKESQDPETGDYHERYYIEAYRNLTSSEIAYIKADSERWKQQRRMLSSYLGYAQSRAQQADWAWGAAFQLQPQDNTSNEVPLDDKEEEVPANEEDLKPTPIDLIEEDDDLQLLRDQVAQLGKMKATTVSWKAGDGVTDSSKTQRNTDDVLKLGDFSDFYAMSAEGRNSKGVGFQDSGSSTHDKSPGAGKFTVGGSSSLGSTLDVQRIGEASVNAGQEQMLVDTLEFETLPLEQSTDIDTKRCDEEVKNQPERPQEYLKRLTKHLGESGKKEEEIDFLLKHENSDGRRRTYTRHSRRHLSLETLEQHQIEYEIDADPDFLLIKRWVPEHEQDFLWNHTRELRQRRAQNEEAIATSNISAGSRRSSEVIELPETAEEEEQRQKKEMDARDQVRMTLRRESESEFESEFESKSEPEPEPEYKEWRVEHAGRLEELLGRAATTASAASSSLPAEKPRADYDQSQTALNEEVDVLLENDLTSVGFDREDGKNAARRQQAKPTGVFAQLFSRLRAKNRTAESATASDSGSADEEGSTSGEKEFMKSGLATVVRDQESGETEVEASPKVLHSAVERMREGAEMSRTTLLAAEQRSRAMELASLEAQNARINAMEVAKRIDEQDPGEF